VKTCAQPPASIDWVDWSLAAVTGAAGSLIGLVGLFFVYRWTRRDDREKQAAIDEATESRRKLQYRVDTVVTMMESMKRLVLEWTLAPSMNLRDWDRRIKRPIAMEFEAFAVRMLVDAPDLAKAVKDESEEMYKFPAVQKENVDDFSGRVDGLYEWILEWAVDPSIIDKKPTFF
jgi:hypothetical protein